MILSASRRTDIPAVYTPWFINRLREGFVLSRDTKDQSKVYRTDISPKAVDFCVFWTKNAEPMIQHLDELEQSWPFMFQYTLTGYGSAIEKGFTDKVRILENMKRISDKIGAQRLVWRYDPIVMSPIYTHDQHCRLFEHIAKNLSGRVERCVVSLLDPYQKIQGAMKAVGIRPPTPQEGFALLSQLSKIAQSYSIAIETCAENGDFTGIGITPTKCIDDELIARICKNEFRAAKDQYQRKACGCVQSVDIGQYNSCIGRCEAFCYATTDHELARQNAAKHIETSPFLIDSARPGDKIISVRATKLF